MQTALLPFFPCVAPKVEKQIPRTYHSPLQLLPRVDLVDDIAAAPSSPVSARLGDNAGKLFLGNVVRAFEYVDVETGRDVPGDVTMLHNLLVLGPIAGLTGWAHEWPDTRVVSVDLHNLTGMTRQQRIRGKGSSLWRHCTHITRDSRFYDSAVCLADSRTLRPRHELDVPPLCVFGMSYATVPVAEAFRQNLEVVAVHMHWMVAWVIIFDDHAYTCITAEIVHVPLLGLSQHVAQLFGPAQWDKGRTDWIVRERGIPLACEQKQGIANLVSHHIVGQIRSHTCNPLGMSGHSSSIDLYLTRSSRK